MIRPDLEKDEKDNLLDIISKTKLAVKNRDSFLLKELSNRTVHAASIYQDADSITLAVVIYSLYKIFTRPDYDKYKEWPVFLGIIGSFFERAEKDVSRGDIDSFRKDLLSVRKSLSKISGNLRQHIEEVFRGAMISKASRIYEHGISMDQTASLLGITVFELAEYAGKTGISDVNLSVTADIDKRLKKTMEFFSR